MKSKHYSLFLAIMLLVTSYKSLFAQAPDYSWVKETGGTIATDEVRALFSALDDTGNIYCTGYFRGTIDFDGGPGAFNLTSPQTQTFISKTDSSGNLVWAKAFSNNLHSSYGHGITLDGSGNVILCGQLGGTTDFDPGPGVYNLTSTGATDIYYVKLDNAGNFIWAKITNGTFNTNASGRSCITDAAGNIYITGQFQGPTDFDPDTSNVFTLTGAGASDIFISKSDSQGNFLWAGRIGGLDYDAGNHITLDANNNMYITGYFANTTDFDPGPGVQNLTNPNPGYSNTFILKLDSAGSYIWAKSMYGSSNAGSSLYIDAYNHVNTTGFLTGTVDFDPGPGTYNLTNSGTNYTDLFISQLDTAGNFLWAVKIGAGYRDDAYDIACDNQGSIYVVGYFSMTVDFDPSAGVFNLTCASTTSFYNPFILKLTNGGAFAWAKAVEGSDRANFFSLSLDHSGNIYLTGVNDSPTLTFSPSIMFTNNITNAKSFIAKLANPITGINDTWNNNEVYVYPNPATTELKILISDNLQTEFILSDISSRKVVHEKFVSSITLSIEGLSGGIYIYELKNKSGVIKKGKIIKE